MITMPWHNRDYLHLGVLICCLPLQYYLSYYNSSKVDIRELTNGFPYLTDLTLPLYSWLNICNNYFYWLVTNLFEVLNGEDESPAIEVFEYRKKHGMQEKKARRVHLTRPDGLWFRVGQVVEHILDGYKGVIVEWDFNPEKSKTPLYRILIDEETTDGIEIDGIMEVQQDKLYLLKNTQITNRFLKNYFTSFDGSQYIPQPWLHQLYPKD